MEVENFIKSLETQVRNLQLQVSAQLEELHLLRNGASVSELISSIKELESSVEKSESENERLRQVSSQKDTLYEELFSEKEKIRFLAKKLNLDKESLHSNVNELGIKNTELITQNTCLQDSLFGANEQITLLQSSLETVMSELQVSISEISVFKSELSAKDDLVEKLQEKNADLVKEKGEKSKQMKQLTDELTQARHFNTQIKKQLDEEHQQKIELKSKLKAAYKDKDNHLEQFQVARNELEATRRSRDILQSRFDNSQTEIFELHSCIQPLKDSLHAATVENNAFRSELVALQAMYRTTQNDLQETKALLAETRAANKVSVGRRPDITTVSGDNEAPVYSRHALLDISNTSTDPVMDSSRYCAPRLNKLNSRSSARSSPLASESSRSVNSGGSRDP